MDLVRLGLVSADPGRSNPGSRLEKCVLAPGGSSNRLAFVAAQIVEDDNIAWPESWGEELLDVSHEADRIDRTIEDAGRVNAVAAQGGKEVHGFPVPVRDARRKPPTMMAAPCQRLPR